MNSIDWDNRYIKHCVRKNGWLPASLEYMKRVKKESIKYFTLCDSQAIDIVMLEKAGILKRDMNGKLPNVIICEGDPNKLIDIYRVVKPPLDEFIINEKLEDLLTLRGIVEVEMSGAAKFDTPRGKEERKRIRLYRRFEKFKMCLPFDIINFDPSNSLLDRTIDSNRLYQALESFFLSTEGN